MSCGGILNDGSIYGACSPCDGRIVLSRSRAGGSPVFYHRGPGGFVFGDSLEELTSFPGFDRNDLRMDAVLDFLAVQYIPGEKTIYNHTFKLLPGYTLTFDIAARILQLEETAPFRSGTRSVPDYNRACDLLRSTLTDVVKQRMDAGTGVFLSGGLDSAILCSIAAGMTSAPLPVYSAVFEDAAYNEGDAAKETAAWIRRQTGNPLPEKTVTVTPACIERLTDVLAGTGEPFADSSVLPLAAVCGLAAADGMTSALTGDGADELFYGYERYRVLRLCRIASLIPGKRLISSLLSQGAGERSFAGRLRRFLNTAVLSGDAQRYFSIISHNFRDHSALLNGAGPLADAVTSFGSSLPASGTDDPAVAADLFDLKYYLPGDAAVKAKTASILSGLELKTPVLDDAVADLALSLPAEYKLCGSRRKKIFGDAFAPQLPPDLVTRRKRGFGVPVSQWLRKPWLEQLRSALLDSRLMAEWFDRGVMERMISEHETGRNDHAYLLFSLLMLSLWLTGHGKTGS